MSNKLLRIYLFLFLCLMNAPATTLPVSTQSGSSALPPILSASWSPAVAALWTRPVYNARTAAVISGGGSALPVTLAGDGTTDDRPNLQAQLSYIHTHGGGVLYLPTGTYWVDNSRAGLTIGNTTAIVGDGPGVTNLVYPSGQWPIVTFVGSQTAGISNLSLTCTAGPEPAPYNSSTIRNAIASSGAATRLYLKNVTLAIGPARSPGFSGASHVDVEDCTIDATISNWGPLAIGNCSDVLVARNTLHGHNGRISLIGNTGLVYVANHLSRDGGVHTPVRESGGVDVSYSPGAVVTDNLFTTIGIPYQGNNDGEEIMAQNDGAGGGAPRFRDAGTLTGTTSTTLTDSTKAWAPAAWPSTTIICLTSGAGLGEWRAVRSHTASTFTPAAPWTRPPAAGDTYSLWTPAALNLTIKNNRLINNAKGIELYSGAIGCTITGNTLTNSGSLFIHAWDRISTGNILFHELAWNNSVRGNRVSNPNGQKYSALGILAIQNTAAFNGNLAHGNTIVGNTIIPHAPGVATPQDIPGVTKDGTYYKVIGHPELPNLLDDKMHGATNGR